MMKTFVGEMSSAKKEKSVKKPQTKPSGAEKSSGGGGGAGGKAGRQQGKAKPSPDLNDDVKRDQKLQAILLADSFSKTFRPITLECPKVLLPLVNVPMLEYTVEFLAQNGVEEIFVFCASHADKVEKYVKERRWNHTVTIRCISSPNCQSAGDALRELDAMNIIRSDPFILISGDVVSNLDLKRAISYHQARRKEDANAILTVVLKQAPRRCAPARPILDDLVVGMNRRSGQIVLFEDSFQNPSVSLSTELLADCPDLVLCPNLLDCNVDICSPELILQFSDNFDYQDIRRDFIQNEVCNYSLGKHIYGYVLQEEYAARVQDCRTYHTISRDLVTRWVYPLVPDVQLLQDSSYVQGGRYVYRENAVKVSRTAKLVESVVIGAGSTVAEDVVLSRCTIGRGVSIGPGAVIKEAHVWKGAKIEAGAHIEQAMVCDDCVVGANSVVPRGCVVSFGVVLPPNTVLPEYSRVFRKEVAVSEGLSTWQELPGTEAVVWQADDSVWPVNYDPDACFEDMPEELSAVDSARALRMSAIGCVEEEDWKRRLWRAVRRPEEEVDSDDELLSQDAAMDLGAGLHASGGAAGDFVKAVEELVAAAHSENHDTDAVLMEIKGMKFAQNKTFADCLRGALPALLACAAPMDAETLHAPSVLRKLKEVFTPDDWAGVLLDALVQSPADEVAVVDSLEQFVLTHTQSTILRPLFRFFLQVLYDAEIVSDEGICLWSGERAAGLHGSEVVDDGRAALFADPKTQEFVAWVKQDEEEETEEEGDSDEGSDDNDESDDE